MIVTTFDSESNGFLDVADKLWCIAEQSECDGVVNEGTLFTPDKIAHGFIKLSQADVLVGHNIIKHDLPLFKKLYGWEPSSHQVVVDTLVLSRMLNPKRPLPFGYKGKATHSIEAWGYRLGFPKPDHEDWSQYSEEMGNRCVVDTLINRLVLEELEREAGYLSDYYEQVRLDVSASTRA